MPNLSNTVTFLFAGDGSLASDGLSAFLQTKSNFLLLSECSDGSTTVADITSHKPEIAVIDAQLPDMNARQIIEAVRKDNLDTKIIVLGASADRNIADELLSAGGDAYIVRGGPSRHLNDAIRYVRDGGKYLAPELTRDMPVSAVGRSTESHGEAISSLRAAVEAQALTMARLEHAMDRAQYAIELLQQKVEQLSGAPIEPPPSPPYDRRQRSRILPGIKTATSTVAAGLVLAVLGFQFAGILKPAPARPVAKASTAAAGDSSQANPSTSLTGWEWENVENARSLLRNQQYVAAEKLCRMVLEQNPANVTASRILASALFHQDKISESADVVRSIAVPRRHRSSLDN
jgi:DNA-binding NarL/FixJ family response regulator